MPRRLVRNRRLGEHKHYLIGDPQEKTVGVPHREIRGDFVLSRRRRIRRVHGINCPSRVVRRTVIGNRGQRCDRGGSPISAGIPNKDADRNDDRIPDELASNAPEYELSDARRDDQRPDVVWSAYAKIECFLIGDTYERDGHPSPLSVTQASIAALRSALHESRQGQLDRKR